MIFQEDNKLFKVTTEKLGDFYVVAKSFDEASQLLVKRLEEADYGYSDARDVKNIELLGCEHIFNGKQSFGGIENLVTNFPNPVK